MSGFARPLVVLAALCALMQFMACAGITSGYGEGGLPALSSLDSRSASGVVDVSAQGKETLARSQGCIELGNNLYLGAMQGTAEWAIYRLTPPAGMTPQNAMVVLTDVSTDEAWTAVANYGTSRWDFSGPHTAATGIANLDATHVSPGGHVYLAVVVSSTRAGVVESVSLTCEGNLPPVASFTATPQTGQPGEPVTLDASGSTDPDGTIAKYEWDLDGDGSYEFDSGLVPTAPTALPDPAGSALVGVRVSDDAGSMDTETLALTSSNSSPVPAKVIDSSSTYNLIRPVLLTVNGHPAVVYLAWNLSPTVRYLRANDPDGTSWGASQEIAAPEDAGTFTNWPRAAVVNGKPAIAYITIYNGNRAIFYKQANDIDGVAWGTAIPVAIDLNVAADCSLAVVQGNPAIAYKGDDSDTRFIRSIDADGATWGTSKVCGVSDDDEYGVSLAIVNGNPAVGFATDSSNDLILSYNRATDAFGGSWPAQVDILTFESSNGFPTFLTVANGNPAMVSLSGAGPGVLYFIRATDENGTAWDASTNIGTCYNSSYNYSMSMVGSVPAAMNVFDDGLFYRKASNANGSAWDPAVSISKIGGEPSISSVNGGAAFVWKEGDYGLGGAELWYQKLD